MDKIKKFLLLALAGAIFIGGLVFAFFYYGTFSEGYRAGMIMKLTKKGVIFKTYEGDMDIGGLSSGKSGNAMPSSVWSFSVEKGNEDVIKSIESAMLSKERVKLYYVERYAKFPWRGDTKYFITKIESSQNE